MSLQIISTIDPRPPWSVVSSPISFGLLISHIFPFKNIFFCRLFWLHIPHSSPHTPSSTSTRKTTSLNKLIHKLTTYPSKFLSHSIRLSSSKYLTITLSISLIHLLIFSAPEFYFAPTLPLSLSLSPSISLSLYLSFSLLPLPTYT